MLFLSWSVIENIDNNNNNNKENNSLVLHRLSYTKSAILKFNIFLSLTLFILKEPQLHNSSPLNIIFCLF